MMEREEKWKVAGKHVYRKQGGTGEMGTDADIMKAMQFTK